MVKRARRVKREGFKRYEGSTESIAKQIIEGCWDKKSKYFRVSTGHFNEFYCRDFGMCVEALIALGHRKRVLQTLDYALSHFQQHGRITTTISPKGKCFDFPYYGADSLPFIIHSLKAAKANDLINRYKSFLKQETDFYFHNVFSSKLNLVRIDKHFSSMKDQAKRESCCYDNCMLFMLARDLDSLKLYNPFPKTRIQRTILSHFWNGNYFFDDTGFSKVITGDANTYPFWCGVTDSKEVFTRCMESMEKARLTTPFPLKYTGEKRRIHRMHFTDYLSGGYERNTIWMHLGLCFLDVVKSYDKARFKKYINMYRKLIDKYNNFLEVYDAKGRPFSMPFYAADESMLWVSKYLVMKDG